MLCFVICKTLAESTQNLSDSLKKTQPNIPWKEISGFRNAIAHGYLGVDLNLIWSVIESDLGPLNDAVEEMLETTHPNSNRLL